MGTWTPRPSAGEKHAYTVMTVNSVGLKSQPSANGVRSMTARNSEQLQRISKGAHEIAACLSGVAGRPPGWLLESSEFRRRRELARLARPARRRHQPGKERADPLGRRRNAVWKTAVPGIGHASPIVWGDRIFTVTALPEKLERVLLCFDRATGKILWQTDRRAGAAGEDQPREQLCLRHAGHGRQAGLCHLPRRRRDRRGRARRGRRKTALAGPAGHARRASGASATNPCCSKTRSSWTATARAIPS